MILTSEIMGKINDYFFHEGNCVFALEIPIVNLMIISLALTNMIQFRITIS
jgi:hypothetical protein